MRYGLRDNFNNALQGSSLLPLLLPSLLRFKSHGPVFKIFTKLVTLYHLAYVEGNVLLSSKRSISVTILVTVLIHTNPIFLEFSSE